MRYIACVLAFMLLFLPPDTLSVLGTGEVALEAQALSISPSPHTMAVGATVQFKLSGLSGTPKWSSSNTTIATVTNKGIATGRAPGFALITARSGSKSTSAQLTITGTTPSPVNCVLSDWALQTVVVGTCTDSLQTRTETWTRTIITQPSGGGAACGPLSEDRVTQQACIGDPPSGLPLPTAFWELSEASGTRLDSRGTHHLTDNNTVTSTTGKVGVAANLSRASAEDLSIADNAALSGGDRSYTIAGWVLLNSIEQYMAFVSKAVPGNAEFELGLSTSPTTRFRFHASADGSTWPSATVSATAGPPVIGQWYFLVAWHDAEANTLNLRVNNGSADTVSYGSGIFDGTAAFRLGSWGGYSYHNGRLDQVGIWAQVLSDAEQTWLWNGGAGRAWFDIAQPVPPSLTITTTTLSNATVGTPYTTCVSAAGGTPPYTWDKTAGVYPAGLTLVAGTGCFSGTPTTAETQAFTVRVTDSLSAVDTQVLSLTVACGGGSIAPTSQTVTSGGATHSAAVTIGTGCAWTAAESESWLSINSGSSGTGNGTVSYTATANTGAQRVGTLTIAGQTLTVTQQAAGGGGGLAPADVTVASCEEGPVDAALDATTDTNSDGLIVIQVPAGTCTWTTSVEWWGVRANVWLRGAGDSSLTAPVGGSGHTVIIDNINRSGYDAATLQVDTNASGTFRMSGFKLQKIGNVSNNAYIRIGGASQQIRIDHNDFDGLTYVAMLFAGQLYGVVDHNLFHDFNGSAVKFFADTWGGAAGHGDGSWSDDTTLGSNRFIFLENNTFQVVTNGGTQDSYLGSRFVIRYNHLINSATQTHPTGGSGRARGTRAWEIYGNTTSVSGPNQFNLFYVSSGTGVIWGNAANSGFDNFVTVHSSRRNSGTYSQSPTPNGWGYCGTSFTGTGSGWDGNTNATTGYPCLDQPGRGKSDAISGNFPNVVRTASGKIEWPNQALEPIYEWNNTWTAPGLGGFFVEYEGDAFTPNVDYYLHRGNSSCNPGAGSCTGGVGVGTLAQRPVNCTTGVAWWATDQGEWNSTNGAAADGKKFVCTATNTWTARYGGSSSNTSGTPYTYPHPLIQ